ncbi:hypothetical protein M5X17_31855 [Paenibacillus alvei]|uniref:Uncharacterized protein n=1 Tax=Paenibacillus alvei TaxID=44250 RepID=A0ABT4H899_PAEAL|nr:hypothetical protein [Paenibacillus alvei]EJW14467.1 hypothetical protein PAV_13c00860 [Paenibacillus alvei DSM 29]EJW19128.1 hypothetical protein PAV_1c00990 [Paenibacillus alvei DSM 29]MCY9738289.1 hypothetical protein [Paenibacillus alvei]MCY9765212.1 hypothetical protein [Paenibacillus alvei]MCY9770455.1 hypothetical protein [Paenibacillus alvei]
MFNPDGSIEKLKALIEVSKSKGSETVEIPLDEARQILNHFTILNRQANRMSRSLGELKDMADQGRLIRIED